MNSHQEQPPTLLGVVHVSRQNRRPTKRWLPASLLIAMLSPAHAHASIFKGEALDKLADVLAWVVLVIAPVIGIAVFWVVHILPEKIAEKRQHPQAKAIQCLCLLSLAFGGLLWPLAWLWAYSKPVLYRMAYGTDKVAHTHEEPAANPDGDLQEELQRLRQHIAELETKVASSSTTSTGGKA
jgi:CBS domain containing-hemolysin-like protein